MVFRPYVLFLTFAMPGCRQISCQRNSDDESSSIVSQGAQSKPSPWSFSSEKHTSPILCSYSTGGGGFGGSLGLKKDRSDTLPLACKSHAALKHLKAE